MYLSNYDLKEKPFQITTDSRFLWLGEKHKEAFATLKYGILDNKGFLLLTGDVGTGKTTLINALAKSLSSEVILAKIPDPKLDEMDFFRFLANAFRIKEPFGSKGEFLLLFTKFLEKAHVKGRQVLLIADEAQRLSPSLLEEIRHLSNIEKEHVKLLNIFFVGQVEFNNVLLQKKNRAIRQRITLNYVLEPLTEEETGLYIRHRLAVAGCKKEVFTADAVHEIFKFSHGAPRLINIVCDRSLLTGFVESKKTIDGEIIRECAGELEIAPYIEPEELEGLRPKNPAGTGKNKASQNGEEPSPANAAETSQEEEREEVELDLSGIRKKKGGMFGIYLIYLILIILIGAICGYFFYLPS